MTARHRLVETRTVYAPTHEHRGLGAFVGAVAPIAGLAVLASFYNGPIAVVVPPPDSSSVPTAAVPAPLFEVPVKPALHLTDFSRMSGDTRTAMRAAPSTGADGHSNWGDAHPLHHGYRPDGGRAHGRHHGPGQARPEHHRGLRGSHWVSGAHRAGSGRHRHLDGHPADRGHHHHRDSGRHASHHVGGHHQGAHSHGGHHRG